MPEGTTLARAKEKLREIEDQLSKGVYLPEKKIPTFGEVAKEWLQHKKPNLRASTWSVYEGHTRNHFNDLNHIRINRITTARVERYIAERQARGVNILTLRKVLVSLGQIFSYAVRHKYIGHNPFRDAERPRRNGTEEKKTIRILNTDEIKALLASEPDQKYNTLFRLAIFSGARQGELLGLKWTDVDWINNQIHIQRTFNNGAWYIPKTKTSNRRIDLGPGTMSELRKWKVACPPNELDLIFPNNAGNPINHNNLVNRHFKPAMKRADIKGVHFHCCRHTFASLLIEQGENIKYIQAQLGHSSPTVTLNVYAHLMKPTNQRSARTLENTVFSETGSKMVANNKKGSRETP